MPKHNSGRIILEFINHVTLSISLLALGQWWTLYEKVWCFPAVLVRSAMRNSFPIVTQCKGTQRCINHLIKSNVSWNNTSTIRYMLIFIIVVVTFSSISWFYSWLLPTDLNSVPAKWVVTCSLKILSLCP